MIAPAVLTLLEEGRLEVKGRLPWSSNHTFLGEVTLDGASSLAGNGLGDERGVGDEDIGTPKHAAQTDPGARPE